MSSLSMPISRKVSDGQFIGDLMSLFERRKLKCGEPQIFEAFASELVSNNILRSDLFTLCTAISHMAAEDLSGDELLALVARALAGPGVAKGGASAEIPESMRTAFLDGYKAWSNRGQAIDEPLPWPPVRQAPPREEPATASGDAGPDSSATMEPAESHHTMQEALHLARERAGVPLVMHRLAASAENVEHLTINELKKLLAEIENRMSRMAPHTAGVGPPATQAGSRRSAEAGMAEGDVRAAGLDSPGDISRALRGEVLPFEFAGRPAPARSKFDEAFLERHPYMKPSWRPATADEAARDSAVAFTAAPAPAAAVPASAPAPAPAPAAPVSGAPVAREVNPGAAPLSPGRASAASVGVANAGAVAPLAGVVPPAPPAVPFAALLPAGVSQPAPFAHRPPFDAPGWIDPDGPRLRFRISLRGIALMAALFIVAGGSAGFYVYHSLRPKTMDDFPDLKALLATSGGQEPAVAHDAGSDAEMILSGPDDSPTPTDSAAGGPDAPSGVRSKPRAKAQPGQPTAVAVWPQSNHAVSGDVGANPWGPAAGALAVARHGAGGGGSAGARWTAPAGGPLHVPSTTMMEYAVSAPRPVYPANLLKGIDGTVVIEVAISREGSVTGAWAMSGPDQLRPAAVQAVQGWRFRPYMVDGNPVEVTTTLGFFFNGR